MVRARSKQEKDKLRREKFRELKRLWNTARYDKERAETVSMDTCLHWDIDQGDVLADSRGFRHPELAG